MSECWPVCLKLILLPEASQDARRRTRGFTSKFPKVCSLLSGLVGRLVFSFLWYLLYVAGTN